MKSRRDSIFDLIFSSQFLQKKKTRKSFAFLLIEMLKRKTSRECASVFAAEWRMNETSVKSDFIHFTAIHSDCILHKRLSFRFITFIAWFLSLSLSMRTQCIDAVECINNVSIDFFFSLNSVYYPILRGMKKCRRGKKNILKTKLFFALRKLIRYCRWREDKIVPISFEFVATFQRQK